MQASHAACPYRENCAPKIELAAKVPLFYYYRTNGFWPGSELDVFGLVGEEISNMFTTAVTLDVDGARTSRLIHVVPALVSTGSTERNEPATRRRGHSTSSTGGRR